MMYSQIWLNLLMDDHHFGYIKRKKNPGHILWNTISCTKSNCQSLVTPPRIQLSLRWQTKLWRNNTKRTWENDTKRTQITLWVQEIQETKPSSYLEGGGEGCGGGITTTYQVLNCLQMEHAHNDKQKIVSIFAQKGLQEKQSRMKKRKGKEAALLLLPTWDLYTRYQNNGELPTSQRYLTDIFIQVS